jgi:hypothetical protein
MRLSRGVPGIWESLVFSHLGMMGLATALLSLAFVGPAFAQVATGTITGTVTDPKGAAMAGVNVLVHNDDTGVDQRPVMTNNTGVYSMPLLQPGNYDVTASQTGFATVQRKGVTVEVGSTIRIDIEMPVASQQSLVTVTTEAPLVDTEKTEQSQTIGENLVTDLPVSSRNWQQFVLLTPGVTPDGTTGQFSFHGLSGLYNNNSVDGANNYNSYNGTDRGNGGGAVITAADGYVYSPDSIKEFQVASSNMNAELGQAGGTVNAVTKSGTSNIHGDAYENIRNPVFNAVDPASKASLLASGLTATQAVHQQNQFGGSAGGPIVKDKLFYFVTYDGYRKVTPIAYTTTQTNPPVGSLACPNPVAIAPSTTFVSAAQCAAAQSWVLSQVIGQFPRELRQDIFLAKIDYQLNAANHLNAVFNWRNWYEPFNTAYASVNNSGAAAGLNNGVQDRFFIGTWTTLIGSNKVNELRYQWGKDVSFDSEEFPPPNVALSNLFTYGGVTMGPNDYALEHINEVSDNFTFTKGAHTFKTGVDLNFIQDQAHTSTPSQGSYSYSSAVALPKSVGCASDTIFCDWLVDLYGVNLEDGKTGQHWAQYSQNKDQRFDGATPAPQAFFDNFPIPNYSGYFQDTWKARPNLTVNAGLRYGVQIVPPMAAPNASLPILTEFTSTDPIDWGGIQPRLGFSWNFKKNSVLRASGGIFTGNVPGGTLKALRKASGLIEQRFICTPAQSPCTALTFPNVLFNQYAVQPAAPFNISGLPANQQPLTPTVLNPSGNNCSGNPTCEIRGISPDTRRPSAYEVEAAYEQQLPGNISITASYVFTRGIHLPTYLDANLEPNTATKTYDVVNGTGATQLQTTVPLFTTPVAGTTGPVEAGFSGISSTYNAMVLTARSPMIHSLQFLINYTLSKATDDGEGFNSSGGGGGNATPSIGVLDPFSRTGALGLTGDQSLGGADSPNNVRGTLVWQPGFAKNVSGKIERELLGGWSLAGIFQYSSNTRYSEQVQSSNVQCSTTGTAPACSSGGIPAVADGMTGALDSGGGRVTWLPRNSFSLPSYTSLDMRLTKEIHIHERYNIELRAEAFNLFNNQIVLAVNTTGYTYAQPSATSTTCPSTGANAHTNTCMIPVSGFQTPTTTSSNSLGARQLQFGARFNF